MGLSPKKTVQISPKKNTPAINIVKKPQPDPKNIAVSPIKKARAPVSPMLSKNKPSTSKDTVDKNKPSTSKDTVEYMPTPASQKTANVNVEKRKTAASIDKIMKYDDKALERALEAGVELIIPVDATDSRSGTRKTTLEELALFNAKTNVILEKKVDMNLDHIERTSNLEGQLQFSLPCKDYKRVLIVDN
ncbi:hypothetical protein B566_EDAN013322 [Ephemera danica]|nr:hypothetical protein B566_EDAN013322 [Ephemera danica]